MLKGRKVALCGFDWAGCKALELLLSNGCDVQVFTHECPHHIPDLARYAERNNVPFSKRAISLDQLLFKPDLICSVYYRDLIPGEVLSSSHSGGINLHPSLLPNYRGCSSLTWALVNGEPKVGFTFHYMTTEFDKGNVLVQKEIDVEGFDLQTNLYQRVMFSAMNLFMAAVERALSGDSGEAQKSGGEYYKRGAPFGGEIQDGWSHEKVERFIRALIYPPYPVATFRGQEVKKLEDYLRVLEEKI